MFAGQTFEDTEWRKTSSELGQCHSEKYIENLDVSLTNISGVSVVYLKDWITQAVNQPRSETLQTVKVGSPLCTENFAHVKKQKTFGPVNFCFRGHIL